MKRIMMMGPFASGKTSLIQRLKGEQICYRKTQAVELDGNTIDTPGEYMENRQYQHALAVTACDADIIVFTQDPTVETLWYSPGQASMFSAAVIGVITKIDMAEPEQIAFAQQGLQLAGVEEVFAVSSMDGTGLDSLLNYLTTLEE